jgi:hypothetical protein
VIDIQIERAIVRERGRVHAMIVGLGLGAAQQPAEAGALTGRIKSREVRSDDSRGIVVTKEGRNPSHCPR